MTEAIWPETLTLMEYISRKFWLSSSRANLDAETEARVLEALRRASEGRTALSVSHRIYENLGGRTVEVRTQNA